MTARTKSSYIPLLAALSLLAFAGVATAAGGGGRDYALADRLIDKMEQEISCLVSDYRLEIRGVRPTLDQRSFKSAIRYVEIAVDRLRDAFDDDGGYNRVHYRFNQLDNKFKGAAYLCDRARVSPSARRHLSEIGSAIASFKRLRSSRYGFSE